jgi:hypothetical protein
LRLAGDRRDFFIDALLDQGHLVFNLFGLFLYVSKLSVQPLKAGIDGSVSSTSGWKPVRVRSVIGAMRRRSPAPSV